MEAQDADRGLAGDGAAPSQASSVPSAEETERRKMFALLTQPPMDEITVFDPSPALWGRPPRAIRIPARPRVPMCLGRPARVATLACEKCQILSYCGPACREKNRERHAAFCEIYSAGCEYCGRPPTPGLLCKECGSVRYCRTECLSADRIVHSRECKGARRSGPRIEEVD
jgi:hypothetical protein